MTATERQAAAIERWLKVFSPLPGQVVELRAIKSSIRGAVCRAFNDLSALAQQAVKLDQSGNYSGCYFTLNPLRTEMVGSTGSACKADVLCRHWLPIDCDPERSPAESNSNEEERRIAWKVLDRCRATLEAAGLKNGIVGDSGNGWHLCYPIDLPNDDSSQELVKAILVGLGKLCDERGKAKVDPKPFDAPRIWKLYGTRPRKGPHSKERPQRWAHLLEGEKYPCIPWNEKVADENSVRLKELLSNWKKADELRKGKPTQANDSPVVDRARKYVATMAPAISGQHGHDATFNVAQVLLRGFSLSKDEAWPIFLEFNERCEPQWSRHELEHKLADALEKSSLPKGYLLNGHPKANFKKDETAKEKQKTKCRVTLDGAEVFCGDPEELIDVPWKMREGGYFFEIHSAAQLVRTEFPAINWVVPDLMSEGLNVIAGKPKQGKSMLALNLALTVAGGGRALGNIAVIGGDVLYLSLEDRDRRVSFRIKKMCPSLSVQANRRLMVVTKWPRQNEGGLFLLDKVWWQQVERPTLVIIDTWGKFRPEIGKSNLYEADTRQMTEVKDWADARQCSVLIVHHTRKMEAKDPFDTISGSQGLGGVADGLLVLQRIRNNTEAKISITGRDGQEQELAVRFDPENLTWISLGKAEDYVLGKLQTAIIAYLKSLGGESTFTSDIAAHLDREPDQVRPILHKLFARRLIRREGKAWAYPGEGEHDEEAI